MDRTRRPARDNHSNELDDVSRGSVRNRTDVCLLRISSDFTGRKDGEWGFVPYGANDVSEPDYVPIPAAPIPIVASLAATTDVVMDVTLDKSTYSVRDLVYVRVLFLISKPFFIWSRAKLNHGSLFWEEGRCPVCHGEPALSFTRKEGGRAFSCSYCEAKGAWHRVGCPLCQNRDGKYLEIIEAEQEEGFRLTVCRKCKGYVKMIDESRLEFYGKPDLLDIISIPLDIVAQNQGLQRHAPNPLGMTRIS